MFVRQALSRGFGVFFGSLFWTDDTDTMSPDQKGMKNNPKPAPNLPQVLQYSQ